VLLLLSWHFNVSLGSLKSNLKKKTKLFLKKNWLSCCWDCSRFLFSQFILHDFKFRDFPINSSFFRRTFFLIWWVATAAVSGKNTSRPSRVYLYYTTTLESTAEHIIEVNGASQQRASGLRVGLLTVARHISYSVMSPRTFAPEYVALRRRGHSQSVVPWQQRCAITTHARADQHGVIHLHKHTEHTVPHTRTHAPNGCTPRPPRGGRARHSVCSTQV